ncbi:hypothetical protein [Rhodobacter sp. SGA-6-6]|nr:hypothetical protein [Rhodobacter sp. SGA-6-6]
MDPRLPPLLPQSRIDAAPRPLPSLPWGELMLATLAIAVLAGM